MIIQEMTIQELNKILELHRKWLNGKPHGIRANLSLKDLRGTDLREADLREADLRGADFCGANLRRADLRGADLRGAKLYGADLRGAKNIPFIPMVCPETGSYVALKKAEEFIVVL